MEDSHQYYTVRQASELLGIGTAAVRARIRSGTLRAKKCGRRWCVQTASVLEAQGVPHGLAVYLCNDFTANLRNEFREIVEEVCAKYNRELSRELRQTITALGVEIAKATAESRHWRSIKERVGSELDSNWTN